MVFVVVVSVASIQGASSVGDNRRPAVPQLLQKGSRSELLLHMQLAEFCLSSEIWILFDI